MLGILWYTIDEKNIRGFSAIKGFTEIFCIALAISRKCTVAAVHNLSV